MLWIWKQIIILIACVISSYSIALALSLIFACSPVKKTWSISIITGSCINRPAVYLSTAIANTVSDVILIIIPIRIIWRLHMRPVQKWGVIAMFSIGSLLVHSIFFQACIVLKLPRTIITSIVRLATLMPLVNSNDQPYQLALAGVFM
jgi:hypothetical protein